MNDDQGRLEAELEALRPREPSAELRRQLARRLTAHPSRRWLSFALAAGLAAACLAALVWLRPIPKPAAVPGPTPAPPSLAKERAHPATLLAYQRALAESPESVLDLLDEEAGRSAGLAPPEPQLRLHAFSLSNLPD